MIRPFITGATGFIGRHLVAALHAEGMEFRTHHSGLGDIQSAEFDLAGMTHVIHLAGRSFVPDSWNNPRDYYRVNVQGTANVLEQCRRHRIPVILVSSYVYGQPRKLPVAEDHPREPLNPYAHSKMLAEEIAEFYRQVFELPVTIIRPFNVYGPGQDSRYLIPLLVRQAMDPAVDRFEVADARPRRDFLYVDDLVDLLCASLRSHPGVTVNAGSGRSFGIRDIVDILNRELPRPKTLYSRDENRQTEVMDVVADITLARSLFGWRPRVSLEEGLRRMLRSVPAESGRNCETVE
jgi:nucleoside-diphosphate-sugar epimerase